MFWSSLPSLFGETLWTVDFEGIRDCEYLEKRGEDRHLRALLSDQ